MQLIDKFAIKYYSYFIYISFVAYFIHYLHDVLLAFTFINFNLVIGGFFFKDIGNTPYSKEFNKNIFHIGPLIVSCIMTPIFYYIFWINYQNIVQGSALNWFLYVLTLSQSVVASIDASHELIHRNQKICNVIGLINLWFHQFTVYPIQHLYLHHKKVGTTQDPITSPKNQNVYQFAFNALKSAYKFNYDYNKFYFLLCVLSTLSYNGVVIGLGIANSSLFGKILMLVLVSYFSILFLESIEYIEHYGLIVRKNRNDPIPQTCSWNTEVNGYINSSLFRFQRHSDHHMNAYKIFTSLDLNEKMPLFPFDFLHAMFWAAVPQAWFSIANPLVDQVVEGKTVSRQHHQKIKIWSRNTTIVIISMFVLKIVSKFVIQ